MDIITILAYLILLPFILFNIVLSMITFIRNKFTRYAFSILRKDIVFAQKNITDRIYSFSWVVFGSVGCLVSGVTNVLTLLMIFLAFNSGGNISKQIIFTIHDRRILSGEKEHVKRNFVKIIAILTIIQLLFVLAWAVTYRIVSVSIKTIFGLDADIYIIILWVIGLIIGMIYSFIRTRKEPNLLMRNELTLFSDKKVLKT